MPTFSMTSQKCMGASPKRSFSSSTLRISLERSISEGVWHTPTPSSTQSGAGALPHPPRWERREEQFQPRGPRTPSQLRPWGSWGSGVPSPWASPG